MARQAVCVVGGSGFIGRHVIAALSERGRVSTIATYRSKIPSCGRQSARWIHVDLDRPATTGNLARALTGLETPLASLVWCVGQPFVRKDAVDVLRSEWVRTMSTNALVFAGLYRAVAPICRASRSRVIVLSSRAFQTCTRQNAPYAAAKAALNAIALTLAKEEAVHRVTVNVLAPGYVESPVARALVRSLGRSETGGKEGRRATALQASDLAELVAAMALDDLWSKVTGHVITLTSPAEVRKLVQQGCR